MIEWLLSLHPALLAVIATLGLALGFFAKTQAKRHPSYSLFGILWALITGLAFGVGFGLSIRLLYLLVG
jgi:hypothetical protein